MKPHSLINGIATEFISIDDRGLNYGDGLFETMLYKDGKCQFWDLHISRLKAGSQKLNICFPGEQCFLDDVIKLLADVESQDFIIKLMLTRGSGGRGYAVKEKPIPLRITSLFPYQATDSDKTGINATLCEQTVSINPGLAGIKHLNRLENVIARNEWHDEFQEGIMLDSEKNVIEGTMSNLFIIKNNQLLTPDLSSSGIAGIIRQNILNIANQEQMTVHVKTVSLDELFDADECFISNSIIGIWPIVSLDTREYNLGDTCQFLQNKLQISCNDNAKTIQ